VDFIFELFVQVLLEFFGQAIFEALFEVFGRSAKATQAELFGRGETSLTWRIMAYVLLVAVATGLGLWRGAVAEGIPTFGFWSAVGVTLACGVALIGLPPASAEPPANVWERIFRWWPRRRLAWFATGNAAFAVAYLSAL